MEKREIKFRALVPVNSEGPKSMHYFDLSKIDDCNRLCYADYDINGLMQFTGLKDKAGNEIYEGDVLNFENKFTYDVRFEDAKFVCYHVRGNGWGKWGDLHRFFDPDFLVYGGVEVIGNIFQHPELLYPHKP